MGNRTEIHDKVLNAKSLEDISEAYGIWAKSYDQDLLTELGYQAPARSVELLRKHLATGRCWTQVVELGWLGNCSRRAELSNLMVWTTQIPC